MASQNVKEITTANWDDEVVHSTLPVLVDFWAPWCYPCRLLGPTIERLADQFAGRLKVGKLNTDDNSEMANQYGIDGIPQVLIFRGGNQPVERLKGNQPEAVLAAAINRVLGDAVTKTA
jgi:thioredoxin 1